MNADIETLVVEDAGLVGVGVSEKSLITLDFKHEIGVPLSNGIYEQDKVIVEPFEPEDKVRVEFAHAVLGGIVVRDNNTIQSFVGAAEQPRPFLLVVFVATVSCLLFA